ncbi:MAG: hypothetical protein ACPF9D_05640 [Owenweeksia sp.]
MNAKPSKDAFNRAGGFTMPSTIKDYTHLELRASLNTMSKLAKPGSRDEKFMWSLDDRYMKVVERKEIALGIQHREFSRGVQHGFQREENRYQIDRNFEAGMRHSRLAIIKEATFHYHSNYSMSKQFNQVRSVKGRGMDKG